MTRIPPLLALTFVLASCSDDVPNVAPPAYDFTGEFQTTGTWDLSGPISSTESIGDGVARIMVDGLVERAGAPSFIEGQVRTVFEAALLGPIAAAVDAQTPPEWQVGGENHTALTMQLGGIETETRLTLSGEGASLTGTERITALRIPGDPPFTVDLMALDNEDGEVSVALESPINATVSGTTLTIANHVFVVRLDQMITQVIADQIGADLGPLTAFLTGALDCAALLASIDATDGLTFSVAGQDFGFSAATVDSLCLAAIGGDAERTMGAFSKDTGIELGGPVTGADNDGDGRIDTLSSTATYGGRFTALPIPGDAQINAAFTAIR